MICRRAVDCGQLIVNTQVTETQVGGRSTSTSSRALASATASTRALSTSSCRALVPDILPPPRLRRSRRQQDEAQVNQSSHLNILGGTPGDEADVLATKLPLTYRISILSFSLQSRRSRNLVTGTSALSPGVPRHIHIYRVDKTRKRLTPS